MRTATMAPLGLSLFLRAAAGAGVTQCNLWQPLSSQLDDPVNAVTIYDGALIAGGWSDAVGHHIARWNGSSWQSLVSSMVSVGPVGVLTVHKGELIAGGGFHNIDGQVAWHVARWNGTAWQTLGSGIDPNVEGRYVHALLSYNDDLIVGGDFDTAGGVTANGIARWDGSAWHAMGAGVGNQAVNALAVYDGELIAAGGGISSGFVWSWDGASWTSLGAVNGGGVYALTIYHGDLIAGGQFTTIGGQTVGRMARWNGSSWHQTGAGINGIVSSLKVYNDDLIVGGTFSFAGGQYANDIVRWDGSSWHLLGGGMGNGGVADLTEYNGALIVGGYFTSADGQPANYIARWTDCLLARCPDLTGDGTVNVDDLLAVIMEWGPCAAPPASCVPDIAPTGGDAEVNVDDLLAVITGWGSCP